MPKILRGNCILEQVRMQFSEGMIWRVGNVKSWYVCKIYIVYTSVIWNCLCKNGYVAIETRVHTSPKSLTFKIVTQIIICITTKNARESLGLMHTSGCEPSIAPSAKEAHRSGVEWGGEGVLVPTRYSGLLRTRSPPTVLFSWTPSMVPNWKDQ